MEVGIRELKARLSAYLDRVEGGEMIRVTERGRPKALIVPVPGRLRIEEGIASGWIRPASGRRLTPLAKRFRPMRPLQEILDEDRGE